MKFAIPALIAVLVAGIPTPCGWAQPELDIALEEIAGGFHRPVYVTHAGDGSGRLFVIERGGKIKIIDSQGTTLPTPFLDLGPEGLNRCVSPSPSDPNSEQGLLGLAFHPDYEINGRFFVHYSQIETGYSFIEQYRVSEDPNIASPTATLILSVPQPAGNHNGGSIEFNPHDGCTGCLYIGLGDGGSANDEFMNAQDRNTLLGSILRVNVDVPSKAFFYEVPEDNPFVGMPGRPEIWAYGLRNPFRFSFDRANGRLFVGDVGQNTYEEIDLIEAGDNLGWPIMEGFHCFPPPNASGCEDPSLVLPIAEYGRGLGFSVTGGYVYRGTEFPSMDGIYFFADFGTGRIFSLLQDSGAQEWSGPDTELDTSINIAGFGETEEGELLVVEFGPSSTNGKVHKLVNQAEPQTPGGDLNVDTDVNAIDLTELVGQARGDGVSEGFVSGDVDGEAGIALPDVLDLAPNWHTSTDKSREKVESTEE